MNVIPFLWPELSPAVLISPSCLLFWPTTAVPHALHCNIPHTTPWQPDIDDLFATELQLFLWFFSCFCSSPVDIFQSPTKFQQTKLWSMNFFTRNWRICDSCLWLKGSVFSSAAAFHNELISFSFYSELRHVRIHATVSVCLNGNASVTWKSPLFCWVSNGNINHVSLAMHRIDLVCLMSLNHLVTWRC